MEDRKIPEVKTLDNRTIFDNARKKDNEIKIVKHGNYYQRIGGKDIEEKINEEMDATEKAQDIKNTSVEESIHSPSIPKQAQIQNHRATETEDKKIVFKNGVISDEKQSMQSDKEIENIEVEKKETKNLVGSRMKDIFLALITLGIVCLLMFGLSQKVVTGIVVCTVCCIVAALFSGIAEIITLLQKLIDEKR